MKKNIRGLIIFIMIIIVLGLTGIFYNQFFTLGTIEDLSPKYNFGDNEVDLSNGDIRIAPVLYKYEGSQLQWGYVKTISQYSQVSYYGSISNSDYLDTGSRVFTGEIDYRIGVHETQYCKDQGHSGAFSGINYENERYKFGFLTESHSRGPGWRDKSYDGSVRKTLWCYNNYEIKPYLKFQTIEPIITDGFYNTFELDYNVTLNNQSVKAFLIINNETYYLDSNNKVVLEETQPINSKIYYGFEMFSDRTQSPIIYDKTGIFDSAGNDRGESDYEIKLIPSFTQKEEVIVDEEPIIEENTTIENESEDIVTDLSEDNQEQKQTEDSYTIIWSTLGILVFIFVFLMFSRVLSNKGKKKR